MNRHTQTINDLLENCSPANRTKFALAHRLIAHETTEQMPHNNRTENSRVTQTVPSKIKRKTTQTQNVGNE